MTQLNVKLPIGGRYKLQVRKGDRVKQESGWSNNLVTNNGMNIITATNWQRYCQVGSGSTTPAFTDVGLVAKIADAQTTGGFSSTIDTDNRYLVGQKTYSFLAGAAAGNISEVGIGGSATGNLFSRALVLDSGGSPTSITVLSDEDLIVIYEFWIKQPTADFTDTVSGNNITIRACRVDSTDNDSIQFRSSWKMNGSSDYVFALIQSNGEASAFDGGISTITGFPSGTRSGITTAGGGIVTDDYVNDSHERTGVFTFSTAQANFDIKSFVWGFGPTCWQMELETALTKTSVQTFKLGVKLTWSRDSGPA
jgi:hypothetical protein